MDDRVQTGIIGLIKAVSGYDESKGAGFWTYAFSKVSGEIRHSLRDNALLRYGRRSRSLAAKINRICAEREKNGCPPLRISELAGLLSVSEEETAEALEACRPILSFDAEYAGASLSALPAPDEGFEGSVETKLLIKQLLSSLPEEERELLSLRYYKGLTQSETARSIGVSQPKVSRLERNALMFLREKLSGS